MSSLDRLDSFIKEQKIYLKPGEKAPEGVKVLTGRKQGKYYLSSGREAKQEENKPQDNAQIEKPISNPEVHGLSGEEWVNSLNEEEKSAVDAWQSHHWDEMRQYQIKGTGHEDIKNELMNLNNAMNKDGHFQGEVFRGIDGLSDEDYNKILNSKTVEWNAHCSSSKDSKVALGFAAFSHSGKRVLFHVKTKTGVDITPLANVSPVGAAFSNQQEVILPKGKKYKVVGNKEADFKDFYSPKEKVREGKVTVLTLEEI